MTDPFTLATGVAGLISLCLEITILTRQYVHSARTASKDLRELLQELSALDGVLRQLSQFLENDAIHEASFSRTSALFQTQSACEAKLKDICTRLLQRHDKPTSAWTWPFTKTEHREAVMAIHRWVQTFQFALTIDGCQLLSKAATDVTSVLRHQLQTLEETKKISLVVPALRNSSEEASAWLRTVFESVTSSSAIGQDLFNMKENVEILTRLALDDQMQKNQKNQIRGKEKLLEWISSSMVRPKHLDVMSRRSPSTGEWLLKRDEFQAWRLGNSTPCIWCSGIPGAGKIVLSAIVIDHLESNPPVSNCGVAFTYFDYKNRDSQTVLAIIASLLRQLIEKAGHTPQIISDFYASLPSDRKNNSLDVDQCLAFMQTVCKEFTRVFLVFDALDECSTYDANDGELRSNMISTIQKLSAFATIFITSRPHLRPTQEVLKCVPVDIQAADSDIRAYLKARIAGLQVLRIFVDQDPALRDNISDIICHRAQGMFLLAQLQMDSLAIQTSARNVHRALKMLPGKLTDLFDDAMNRMAAQPEPHAVLAKRVISWIFYARRPLQIAELREALSVEPGDTKLDRSGYHEVGSLLNVCCGLVSIDRQDNVIRLVHYSLQEYLDSHWRIDCPGSEGGIAQNCLIYLTLNDFLPDAIEGPSLSNRNHASSLTQSQWRGRHKFFSYVASYWGEHVKGQIEIELEPLILRLFEKKVHLLYGLQEYNKLMYRAVAYDTWPDQPSPLHLTAYWGLSHIAKVLIDRGDKIETQDARKRTPLVCAVLNGHTDVAHVLIDRGARIDARDLSAATPLHAAVVNNHLEATRLLLECGADPNAQDKSGSTLMCHATNNHNLQMMDLLHRKGASTQKIGESGFSPLEIASGGGHAAIAQWLLLRGANVDMRNPAPLMEAVNENQPHVIRLLLEAGAPINQVSGLGYTALGAAVKKGNLDTVQQLLSAGADVNVTGMGPNDESPLQMAAIGGNEKIVTLLISHKADLSAQKGEIGNVLQMAIYSQNLNIIKLVLSHSPLPSINVSRGVFGTTPLQLAVLLKNIHILDLLLSYRQDPGSAGKKDSRKFWGRHPQHANTDGTPENNYRNSTVNPNIPTPFGLTALHQAVYLSWEEGIVTLMRHGADPHLRDLYGQTCLDWAQHNSKLFRKLGGGRTFQPTPHAIKIPALMQSAMRILTSLLKDPNRRSGRRIDYHYLGHCLLKLGDIDEARTSFEQQIQKSFSVEPTHSINCHSCGDTEEIIGRRFVCHTCADIDLCEKHMNLYKTNPPDPRCKKHQFLETPGPKWQQFRDYKVNENAESVEEWLARLVTKLGGEPQVPNIRTEVDWDMDSIHDIHETSFYYG